MILCKYAFLYKSAVRSWCRVKILTPRRLCESPLDSQTRDIFTDAMPIDLHGTKPDSVHRCNRVPGSLAGSGPRLQGRGPGDPSPGADNLIRVTEGRLRRCVRRCVRPGKKRRERCPGCIDLLCELGGGVVDPGLRG